MEADIIHKVDGLAGEYEDALEKCGVVQPVQQLGSVWKAPAAGVYKLNTNAAFFNQQQLGMGGVLRDSVGDVVLAFCSCLQGNFEVDVGEAIAMRQSFMTAIEAGFRDFVLETDNIKLFHHMKKGITPPNAFGNVVKDILKLLKDCRRVEFSFIRRVGNGVAHSLASLSCNFNECRVWLEEYPLDIQGAICNDLANLML